METSERIQALRKELNLKQVEFAEPLGIDRSYVAALEKGNRQPSETLINLISLQFGVSVTWLKTGEGEMFISPEDIIRKQLTRFGDQVFLKAVENVFKERGADEATDLTNIPPDNPGDNELIKMFDIIKDIWNNSDDRLKIWLSVQVELLRITFSNIRLSSDHDKS